MFSSLQKSCSMKSKRAYLEGHEFILRVYFQSYQFLSIIEVPRISRKNRRTPKLSASFLRRRRSPPGETIPIIKRHPAAQMSRQPWLPILAFSVSRHAKSGLGMCAKIGTPARGNFRLRVGRGGQIVPETYLLLTEFMSQFLTRNWIDFFKEKQFS